mgnify:CR=1 FL=1|jgi:hypothetical protein
MNNCVIFMLIICFLLSLRTVCFERFATQLLTERIDVMQTYHSLWKIPQKVNDNWMTYASTLNRRVFDDTECKQFLFMHFGEESVRKFNYLNLGAHKADLFRYAWLYINGGIYMDIKTVLLKDIDEVFTQDDLFYVIVTDPSYRRGHVNRIFNGVMKTPPKNPIILKMFQSVLSMDNTDDYISNCEKGYIILQSYIKGPLNYGFNETAQSTTPNVFVLKESELDEKKDCGGVLDRYDSCMFIMNGNNKVLKVRYDDYPW